MVKRSKKSKSKRVTLKKKYKIIKKVKEHHKKKRKEAKKQGLKRHTKVEKDPGIPNNWPFKEQELKALEIKRARAIEELEQKKALRKERAQKRKLGLLDEDGESTELAHEDSAAHSNAGMRDHTTHDHSERAFYKELVKVIEASDVIVEVLDARDPLGTRCLDMEKMVISAGPEKRLVLLMNKIDLVPREAVEKWLKYLREEFPAVAFKCSTQEQRSKLGWKSVPKATTSSNVLPTSDCLGADTLIKLLKNYTRSHELKKEITVGVVGLPNVGKSSLINSLKRAHVVNVGATPGLTRSMQEIQLDKYVKLLDCPGVVMLKHAQNDISIALRNCKRIEKLDDPCGPVGEILKLCPTERLTSIYKIPTFSSVDEFLQKVASLRGKLKKGGGLDVEAAARIVLRDWNEGKIPYYTSPPVRDPAEKLEAAIVSELGKEFKVDEVYGEESSFIRSLESISDTSHVEVPPNAPPSLDDQMLAPEEERQQVEEEAPQEEQVYIDMADPGCAKPQNPRGQREKLYTAEGILDPRIAKIDKKKKKKKAKRLTAMDDDYDFAVDYSMSRTDADDTMRESNTGNDVDAADNVSGDGVPMSGVELDA